MTDILYQLLRPWSYIFVKHTSKWVYDYLIPGLVTLFSAGPITYFYLQGSVDIYSKAGLIKDMVSFLATLPGFFIAALAAIATFQKNDIDELMPSATRMTFRQANGEDIEIYLTRRRFLCSLFAYLTAQSLLICTVFSLIIHLTPSAQVFFSERAATVLALAGIWLFFILFWNLLSSTALGLFYLGDRLHHPKS